MARQLNKLSALQVKRAKPRKSVYRLADGGGLMLTVKPTGARLWHFRYRDRAGKDTYTSFGSADDVSLADARVLRDKTRKQLEGGASPNEAMTVSALADKWYDLKLAKWTNEKHCQNIRNNIDNDIIPLIGEKTLARDVTTEDVLRVLDAIKDRGSWDTATRTLQRIQSMFSLAMVLDRKQFTHNPAAGLAEWFQVPDSLKGNFPALAPEDFHEFLNALENRGEFLRNLTRIAIELQMLTALRPGELRNGEWPEIDWESKQWIIPGPKMKMKRDHVVPLSNQAIEWLKVLHQQTGKGDYLFPGTRGAEVMSNATVNIAIRRLGFKGRHCAHGFRSTFSTWSNEAGFKADPIERQLAHVEGNKTRAAYDRAKHIKERTRIMQAWADWIDVERDQTGKVVPIRREKVS